MARRRKRQGAESTEVLNMRQARFLGAALVVALVSPATAGQRYAVVIGIDKYEGMGELKTCRADAKAMAEVLRERAGFDRDFVILMTDDATDEKDRPTLLRIERSIRLHAELARPGDTILVFFSGHGVTRKNEAGEERGYLVPLDGDERSGIPLDKVKSIMAASKADSKLLVLDACHAGKGVKGVGGIAGGLAEAAGFMMLLSCEADQTSNEEEGHGVFTRRLLDGLAGAADADGDKAITQTELFDCLQTAMARWSAQSRKLQKPVFFGDAKARFVLARAESRTTYTPKPVPTPSGDATVREAEAAVAAGKQVDALKLLSDAILQNPKSTEGDKIKARITKLSDEIFFSDQPYSPLSVADEVVAGDSLAKMAQRNKTTVELIRRINGLKSDVLRVGQSLKIIPGGFDVRVDKRDFRLTVIKNGIWVREFKIGLGTSGTTPIGEFVAGHKLRDPVYTGEYPHIPSTDKRRNPLGTRWITIAEQYGIHGTWEPDAIGKETAKGCIRMQNVDVEWLFDLIVPGDSKITIKP
jgi:uncharacterized caspase-like protein